MAQKLRLWVPVIVWMGVIFGFSSLPINHTAEFNWLDFIVKKSAHITEYAILYWLVWRAWSNQGRLPLTRIFVTSLLVTLVYSLSDEWHQTFVPGREGTLRDVGFDTLGMLVALTWLRNKL
ncbi:MAG: VanZ family protein [Patescibacteria group bacterium]|nr:VanZ family protein [Patescibacteria group bacterium]